MGKWWELIKSMIRAWFNFKDAGATEKQQATAKAQSELNDWGEGVLQEEKESERKAHQEIVDTRAVDGGRRAALARLDRLRQRPPGSAGGN